MRWISSIAALAGMRLCAKIGTVGPFDGWMTRRDIVSEIDAFDDG